jgi:Ca2+-binding RTX toxin-like protein
MRRILVLTFACCIAPVSGAWASTAQVSGSMLVYTAGAGETNAISFEPAFFDAGAVAIQDSVPLTPGSGCSAVSSTKVECRRSGLTSTRFLLGDGDDNFAVSGDPGLSIGVTGENGNDTLRGDDAAANVLIGGAGDDLIVGGDRADTLTGDAGDDDVQGQPGPDVIEGGSGKDVITGDTPLGGGAPGDDRIAAGPGRDSITGQGGDDSLDGGGGPDHFFEDFLSERAGGGSDALRGGPGVDQADYGFRVPGDGALRVSLDGRANDGQGGEGDNVAPDVENVVGAGSARNVLVGSGGKNELTGGSQRDRINGRGGNDRIRGNGGRDVMKGSGGRDTFIANDCTPDRLNGGGGRDYATIDLGRTDRTRKIERGRRARCA